jgi:hypothetical protein
MPIERWALPFRPHPVLTMCERFPIAASCIWLLRQPTESKKVNASFPVPESRGFGRFGDRVFLFDVVRPKSGYALREGHSLCYRNRLPKRQPSRSPVPECEFASSTSLCETAPRALFPPTATEASKQCVAEIILSSASGKKKLLSAGGYFPKHEIRIEAPCGSA